MVTGIGTKWMNDNAVGSILHLQAEQVKTQQQISSGKRILTPADDPVAAAQVIRSLQAQTQNARYVENQASARSSLQFEEATLASINELYQQVRTALLSAGNPSHTDQERNIVAGQLRSFKEQLLGLANATNGVGGYLFSGHSESIQPFSSAAGGVSYNGDQGRRFLQVAASRQIPVADNGAELFERIRAGNGVFVSAPAAGNAGSGWISVGTVADPAALNGHSYRIDFSAAGGAFTYDVVDATAGIQLTTGNAYVAGASINVGGMQVSIDGAPQGGDSFSLAPSTSQSVFTTLDMAIGALAAGGAGGAGNARLGMAMAHSIASVDQAFERSIALRADVGARLAELDSLSSYSASLDGQFSEDLARTRDLDLAAAISELNQGQLALEAAQKSYVKLAQLTIFDFI